MTAELTRADFDPHLNEIFPVRPAGPAAPVLPLLLTEVSGDGTAGLESFSLLFKGPHEGVFPHDTHVLLHPVLGPLEVFMGPVLSPKTDGVYYQAVFTRIRA